MSEELIYVKVSFDYVPEEPEEDPSRRILSLEKDKYLKIVNHEDSAWWLAQRLENDDIGWIPANFVEKATTAEVALYFTNQNSPQVTSQSTGWESKRASVRVGSSSTLNAQLGGSRSGNATTSRIAPTKTERQSVRNLYNTNNGNPTNLTKSASGSRDSIMFDKGVDDSPTLPRKVKGFLDRFLQSRTPQNVLLEKKILLQEYHPEAPIPLRIDIIERCILYIETKGINEEGIYRVSGHAAEVRKICNSFRSENFDLSKVEDPHSVAGALKMYFRELVPPIIPFDLYSEFLDSHKNEDDLRKCITLLREVVHKLPAENFQVFKMLCSHLQKISKNSAKNLMTSANMGIIFGTNLLRPKKSEVNLTYFLEKNKQVITCCLDFFDEIFLEKEEPTSAIFNMRISNNGRPTSPPNYQDSENEIQSKNNNNISNNNNNSNSSNNSSNSSNAPRPVSMVNMTPVSRSGSADGRERPVPPHMRRPAPAAPGSSSNSPAISSKAATSAPVPAASAPVPAASAPAPSASAPGENFLHTSNPKIDQSFSLSKLQQNLSDKLSSSISSIIEAEMKNLSGSDYKELYQDLLSQKDARIRELEREVARLKEELKMSSR